MRSYSQPFGQVPSNLSELSSFVTHDGIAFQYVRSVTPRSNTPLRIDTGLRRVESLNVTQSEIYWHKLNKIRIF